MPWIYIWLAVFAISMLIEFLSFELVSVWVSVGSLIALVLAALNVGYEIQIIVAVSVSVICILSLRKVALKLLSKNKEKTNIDAAVGKTVHILESSTEDTFATAKYNGIVFNVTTEDNSPLTAGEFAKIVKIDGNKLIVKKING